MNGKLNLNQEEQLVLSIVLESKAQGIPKANIVKKAQLNDKVISKILERLKLYYYVKPIHPNGKSRGTNYWIGYDQEQESQIQKNSFRNNDAINQDLIDKITQKLIYYLQNQPNQTAQLQDLKLKYKSESGIDFNEQEFIKIIQLLQFDNIIEQLPDQGYKLCRVNYDLAITHMPCHSCPVRKDCYPGNIISPQHCIYEW
ncbi:hypothetical protein pb186bvf_004622 [Paramecium bursaria]